MSSEGRTPLLGDVWAPGPSSVPRGPEDAIASFQLLMADYLMSVEGDDERRRKMRRNVDQEWARLKRVDGDGVDPRQVIYDWINTAGSEELTGLLVEVLYLNPFAPNEINHSKKDLREALRLLDGIFEFDPGFERVEAVSKDATSSHRKTNWASGSRFRLPGSQTPPPDRLLLKHYLSNLQSVVRAMAESPAVERDLLIDRLDPRADEQHRERMGLLTDPLQNPIASNNFPLIVLSTDGGNFWWKV